MTYRLKARPKPCLEKLIYFGPAVEHDGDAILLKDSICLRHRGLEPVCIRVVLDGASRAVAVVHEIWWIGQNEVYRVGWHLAHDLYAVAMKDAVDEGRIGMNCLHDFDLLSVPE